MDTDFIQQSDVYIATGYENGSTKAVRVICSQSTGVLMTSVLMAGILMAGVLMAELEVITESGGKIRLGKVREN